MTNLSQSVLMTNVLQAPPCSILYTLEGKIAKQLSLTCKWDLENDDLREIVIETALHKNPLYRSLVLQTQEGLRETVMIHAYCLGSMDENHVPYVIVSLMDIGCVEQYQHDAQLLDVAVEMIDEAVVITDAHNKIIRVNGAFQKLTGYNLYELEGKNPSFLSSGVTSVKTYQEMWQNLLSDGKWSGEVWDKRKDGTVYPKWLTVTIIRNLEGSIVNYVGVFTDISDKKEAEKAIETLAHYDALTQLPNRRYLNEQVEFLRPTAEAKHQNIALLLIDVDRFKRINDSFGHTAGDRLLLEMAQRIQKTLRKDDLVGRIGGDEFLAVLPLVQEHSDAAEVAEKIIEALVEKPFMIEGHELHATASIGISFFPRDGESADGVIQHAEQAMYMAKKRGGNCHETFFSSLNEATMRRLMIENDLHRGLTHDEFKLLFQPQVDPVSGSIVAVEALIRWHHPTKGVISPVEFIPIAEESGAILELGTWVLDEALRTLRGWLDAGLGPIRMAINVSAKQFAHPDFVGLVNAAIDRYDIPTHLVELEVTESAVMEEPLRAIQICEELRVRGIEFAIDDFGTGYSSLAYLKLFPVKRLKIDKTFVDDIGKDSQSSTLAEVIIALANSLNLEVIAEGVETLDQLQFLKDRGCDLIQGYYYSPPQDKATIALYLKDRPFEIGLNH